MQTGDVSQNETEKIENSGFFALTACYFRFVKSVGVEFFVIRDAIMRSSKFLAVVAALGLSTGVLGPSGHADADVILSNLPGTSVTGETQPITTLNWEAVDLTTGTSAQRFVSLQGLFSTTPALSETPEGGVFSDSSGTPEAPPPAAFDNTTVTATLDGYMSSNNSGTTLSSDVYDGTALISATTTPEPVSMGLPAAGAMAMLRR